MKTDHYNLTTGPIVAKLTRLALPIMGSQLLQMAYNLTDMFWLGRLGSQAVAASGTVGLYMWLSMAFWTFGNKGAEIGVSQNMGRGKPEEARGYAQSALSLSLMLGLLFALVMIIFRVPLIGFFNIQEQAVVQDAQTYLAIVSLGVPFSYLTGTAVGAFNGSGNSSTPFYINLISLGLNMVLDPIMIFPLGWGIAGAAIATVVAQVVGCLLMLLALRRYQHPAFTDFRLFCRPKGKHLGQIAKWATPIAVESFLFTFLSMVLSRFIATFGAGTIASHRIGSQIESLSWLLAGGFSSAFTAFVGQNFGARRWHRIHRGFWLSSGMMAVWGVIVTLILLLFAGPLFSFFLPGEPDVMEIGAGYLRILAYCQFLACLEGIAAGAFRGMGETIPPSVISVLANAGRTLAAWLWLRSGDGIDGIWWAISLGAAARGGLMYLAYLIRARRLPRQDEPSAESELAMQDGNQVTDA